MDGAATVAVKAAPSPKSPPRYPDFCGRRRLQLEVQILNREIGFLEEELQSLEGLQPVSRCCKEVEEFVGSKQDPLVPIDKKRQRSCCLWKCLRSVFCFPFSLLCCFCCQKRNHCTCCSRKNSCCIHCKYQCPPCRTCECPSLHCKCAACSPFSTCSCSPSSCFKFAAPSCSCFHLPSCRIPPCSSSCTRDCHFSLCWLPSCRRSCHLSSCCFREASCCSLPRPSCPEYSCGCVWSCPKCTEARLCRTCCSSKKSSCITGCLC